MDLLAVQGTLKSLLQHHSSKASIFQHSALFTVQLSHPYMTTGKTIVLTRWTFVDKVMSLLFNMLSRLVITFLPRSKRLLISWLQSPSAMILEAPKIQSTTDSHLSGFQFLTTMNKATIDILKSRDIIWSTKVRLVKAMDYKEIQPVHPKGNRSWVFIGRTDVKAETLVFRPLDVKS